MTKQRGLTDYVNDWNMPDQSGDSRKNASGADSSGGDYEYGVPYRQESPPSPEWGGQGSENPGGGFGHSDDCKDTGTKSSAWGMSKEDVARGYEGPEKYDDGVYAQDIPSTNEWDRGAGSDSYAKEHAATTGRGFDGTGTSRNRSGLGSMTIKPGNQQD
jgi:hypothetical protein